MKTTLNKILYKLAEHELINEQDDSSLWQRIKDKFKQKPVEVEPEKDVKLIDTDEPVTRITSFYYGLNPPMKNAHINSKWGKWRGAHRHLGIDMATPVGTPVYAIRPGKVVFIGSQPLKAGDYVITKHDPMDGPAGEKMGETFYALYAHLSDILVSVGDVINFSTVIGKSGGAYGAPGAGNSSGPHLHFEIKTSMSGGSIDPVKFYAKYYQKIENRLLYTDEDELEFQGGKSRGADDINADYIVKPTTSTTAAYDANAVAGITDKKDEFVPGETNIDGFYVYMLPSDNTYLYGVPMPDRTDLTYGWWFANTNNDKPEWKYLKSRLSAANYNIAVGKLNALYPNAIDSDRLAAAEIPQQSTNTTITPDQSQTTTDRTQSTTTKKPTVFSKLKKNTKYTAASLLKSDHVILYSYTNKKFIKSYDVVMDNADYLQYLGHDSNNRYMQVRLISTADHPTTNKRWWINIKDIKLSNKRKF